MNPNLPRVAPTPDSSGPTRRAFLQSAAAASAAFAAFAFPHVMRSQGGRSPNSRLNVACIGVGGRGRAAVAGMAEENLVAFTDVDDERAGPTFAKYPDVPRFRDYREMLDRVGNRIDAVTVSTPDHMHYPVAMAAMSLGKHVFVEKPMSHTVAEARRLAQLAHQKKVATIMGIQGHAFEGTRLLREWFEAGVLGEVREVHSWTNRPTWPQGVEAIDHRKLMPVVPRGLDWDLWLGVAQSREYDPAYLPFAWRGFWDFGTGAFGDMACHLMDGGFWTLGLDAPISVEAASANQTDISAPTASVVIHRFPSRGARPPVKWTWYDGGLQPPLPEGFEAGRELPANGTFVVGSKATVYADGNYKTVRLVPEQRMRELAPSLPPKTLPRVPGGHFAEWIRACKGGKPAGAEFGYASRLTETVLLSNVAIRARQRIEWDSTTMRVTNVPEANAFVSKTYRAGYGV
jgi:predicted dehydrogenase